MRPTTALEPAPSRDRSGRAVGLDWPGLLRLALRDLRMPPAQFWDLTPAELFVLLGLEDRPDTMTRARLDSLSRAYPDTPNRPLPERDTDE